METQAVYFWWLTSFDHRDAITFVTKSIFVLDKEFTVEDRLCANPGCEKLFWVCLKSKQSICSRDCWEVTFGKAWFNTEMPKIRRPGDRRRSKREKKGKNYRMNAINSAYWREAKMKKRLRLKELEISEQSDSENSL